MDYIYGGCKINLSVAVDFSSANKPISDLQSLHSLRDEGVNNKYLQAMKSVVTVLQYYNSRKRIASYGFGA